MIMSYYAIPFYVLFPVSVCAVLCFSREEGVDIVLRTLELMSTLDDVVSGMKDALNGLLQVLTFVATMLKQTRKRFLHSFVKKYVYIFLCGISKI